MHRAPRPHLAASLDPERGNVVLTAMMILTMAILAAYTAFHRFGDTKESFRAERVKNLMSAEELQVRSRALQPQAYLGCTSASAGSCTVNQNFFSDISSVPVSGALCPAGHPHCGIVLELLSLDPVAKEFHAQIRYAGQEVKLKPLQIIVAVPLEVLQTDIFSCGLINPALPFFTGFDPSSGLPICKGFNTCGVGQFVSAVNISTHTLTCKNLPSSFSCPPQQAISSLDWQGGAMSYTCDPLPPPPFTGTPPPPPVCTPQALQNLYDTAVKSFTPTQTEIATSCMDSAIPTVPGNLTVSDQFHKTRFAVTCASRWCDDNSGDNTSVGYIPAALTFDSADPVQLDPNAPVTVECFTNHVINAGACQTFINSNHPLANNTIPHGAANCAAYCGCDITEVAAQYNSGPAAAVSCGTAYCQGQGFKWGVLSEMNTTEIAIRCSKSQALY